jgi:hypothetical protein
MTAAIPAAFLAGCLVGVLAVLVLTGLALWFVEVRRGLREGDEISGEELERNRKRGDL